MTDRFQSPSTPRALTEVPMISIGGYYGGPDIAKEIAELRELGPAGLKSKVGSRDPKTDAERFKRAREAAGSDFILCADRQSGLDGGRGGRMRPAARRCRSSLVRGAVPVGATSSPPYPMAPSQSASIPTVTRSGGISLPTVPRWSTGSCSCPSDRPRLGARCGFHRSVPGEQRGRVVHERPCPAAPRVADTSGLGIERDHGVSEHVVSV